MIVMEKLIRIVLMPFVMIGGLLLVLFTIAFLSAAAFITKRQSHTIKTITFALLLLSPLLLFALVAVADIKFEIKNPVRPPSGVMLRLVGGETNKLYWIERSDDEGTTWEQYLRVTDGQWWYVPDKSTNSLFRGKEWSR
jgi:hypothetical protein